jgi:hypothetical protein
MAVKNEDKKAPLQTHGVNSYFKNHNSPGFYPGAVADPIAYAPG